jgi:nucleotide-binding universal stress UspA family protein
MRLVRLRVGDDGSPGAAAAGTWATAVAAASGGEVTTLHADDATATAELLAAADEIDADLIVVGRRGAGGFDALRLGSVAHQLAEHTSRPLTVVPRGTQQQGAGWPFGTIAVGHDGSPTGAAAVAWVADLAARSGAGVVLAHAVEFGPAFATAGLGDVYDQSLARVASQLEGEWSAPLRDAGVEFTTVMEDAGPAGVLLETAHAHGADLLVVGRREPAAYPGMEMGSVAHRALGFAPCPVVVIPSTS